MFNDDSAERTVYVRGLDERVTKELLEELCTQMGNVNRVVIKEQQQQPGNRYAFVEFQDEESVLFAIEMLDEVELFGRPIRIAPRDNTKTYQLYLEKKPHFVPKNVEKKGGGQPQHLPQPSQPLPYMPPYQLQPQGRAVSHLPPPPPLLQPQYAQPMMEPVHQQPSWIAQTYEPLLRPQNFGQSWQGAPHHPQQMMPSAPRSGAGLFPSQQQPQQKGVVGTLQHQSRQHDRKKRDGWGNFWSGQVPDGNWRGGAAGGPPEQHQPPPQQHQRGGGRRGGWGASSGGRPSQQPWRGRGGGRGR